MYMCVRGIDCVSISLILGLGFGTVLTLLCVVCHFITLFDHWILIYVLIFKKPIGYNKIN